MTEEGKLKLNLEIKGAIPAFQADRRLLLLPIYLLICFCRDFWKHHISTNGSVSI